MGIPPILINSVWSIVIIVVKPLLQKPQWTNFSTDTGISIVVSISITISETAPSVIYLLYFPRERERERERGRGVGCAHDSWVLVRWYYCEYFLDGGGGTTHQSQTIHQTIGYLEGRSNDSRVMQCIWLKQGQSINQSNFYSANIPSEARLSGATAESVLNSKIETVPWHQRAVWCNGV